MGQSDKILPIDSGSVRSICSGQVIIDVATAVKELIENALDAESSNIEVRLKDYGATRIEVADNGTGVAEEDYDALMLRYHTSKLHNFSDLEEISTFGFRGEALSSLNSVADVHFITRKLTQEIGTRLEYSEEGLLLKSQSIARSPGTTVCVQNLFKNMPVRQKDFHKNIKREYAKLVLVLQAYALISTNVRFVCTNQVGNGARSIIISTQGHGTLKENIITVFGASSLDLLKPLEDCELENVKLAGYISKTNAGIGKASRNRQFLYLNGRPVDMPKVTKQINESFRTLCPSTAALRPMYIIDISYSQKLVDINVTPDKRQVIIQNESSFLIELQNLLKKVWQAETCLYTVANKVALTPANSTLIVDIFKRTEESDQLVNIEENSPASTNLNITSKCLNQDLIHVPKKLRKISSEGTVNSCIVGDHYAPRTEDFETPKDITVQVEDSRSYSPIEDTLKNSPKQSVSSISESCMSDTIGKDSTNSPIHEVDIATDQIKNEEKDSKYTLSHFINKVGTCVSEVVDFDIEQLKINWRNNGEAFKTYIDELKFDQLKKPLKNDLVDDNLERVFNKSDFRDLQIIGQFNLGFIVARLKNDLYIIDQHASDEKYNFERLTKITRLNRQPLLHPQSLDLSPSECLTVRHNLHIFEQNGFGVKEVDGKFMLTGVPFSQNTTFGKEDVQELIQILSEESRFNEDSDCAKFVSQSSVDARPTIPRPSKVRSMLAMRACRSSIMIGKALDRSMMKRVVHRLADLDSPWNCPHGRPTMRHLAELN